MQQRSGGGFRAVILDYGAVLSHQPFPHEIARMSRALGVTPEQFPRFYAHARDDYDRGDLTTKQYWESVARKAGVDLAPDGVARGVTRGGVQDGAAVEYADGHDRARAGEVPVAARFRPANFFLRSAADQAGSCALPSGA